jgi:hypothetical protein
MKLFTSENESITKYKLGGPTFKFRAFVIRHSSFVISAAILCLPATLQAYPEFQQHIVKSTGHPVNCAMCHMHADGPEGTAPGQIGHLNAAQQAELGRARAAFEPNAKPNSPILNAFGNHIINSIGKKKFLEVRLAPAQLADLLPKDSDLDGDGIPDASELTMGTHPLIKSDGDPWLLFKANFLGNIPQILLALAATVIGLWGLGHLLRGFATSAHLEEEEETQS